MHTTTSLSLRTCYFADLERVSPFPEKKFNKELVHGWIVSYRSDPNKDLYDQIIYSGLYWVVKLANLFCRHYGLWEHWFDLVQEGNLGLIHALRKFDTSMDVSYSTYSTFWIKHRMARYVMQQVDIVRRPVHVHDRINQLRRMLRAIEKGIARADLSAGQGDISVEEARAQVGMFVKQGDILSLSQTLRPGEDDNPRAKTFEMLFAASDETIRVIEELEIDQLRWRVYNYLRDRFSERDVDMFCMRTGLLTKVKCTLELTGEEFRVTRERVRQVVQKIVDDPHFRWFFTSLLRSVDALPEPDVYKLPKSEPELDKEAVQRSLMIITGTKGFGYSLEEISKHNIRRHDNPALYEARVGTVWLLNEITGVLQKDITTILSFSLQSVNKDKKMCEELMDNNPAFKGKVMAIADVITNDHLV